MMDGAGTAGFARLFTDKPVTVAILAMGGQGGGVLSDWIVALAESEGWVAQSTSVPGVAQRTGATIYYIEMLRPRDGQHPVLSLTPTPGDVDIVLAAEYMEAGRAMLRGLVNPERTVLIASSHRTYAVVEKMAPGDGRGDPAVVAEAVDVAAKRVVAFDMQSLAAASGSVISSVMFGVLAGTGVLPFGRPAFEAAVRAGGKGVEASLRAFGAGFDRAGQAPRETVAPGIVKRFDALPAGLADPRADRLLQRVRSFPEACRAMLFAGVQRVVDYQDVRYADEYLDRMAALLQADEAHGGAGQGHAFTTQAAKYLAVAFCYDDVTRVADLKIRATRFDRVRREVGAKAGQILYTTEYMHPRMEEVLGALPPGVGRFLDRRPGLARALDRVVNRGRQVRTGTVLWFLPLYALSLAKPLRRRSRRHATEHATIDRWLEAALRYLPAQYDFAVEVLGCRRLVKGYSDTHSRGMSKYERVMGLLPEIAPLPGAAGWLRRVRMAALADEDGKALEGAIRTVGSAYAA